MADDELDPAFLDLDLPRLGSSSLQSLGAGFGGSSFGSLNDDDDDEDSFAAQLGTGFGSTLSHELADLSGFGSSRQDHDDGSSDSDGQLVEHDDSPRRVHASHLNRIAGSTDSGDSDDSHRCAPGRKRRVPSRQQLGSTATLAAELGVDDAGQRPERERALLQELGLQGDDDDDHKGARGTTYGLYGHSSEGDEDPGENSRQNGQGHRHTRPASRTLGRGTRLDPTASPDDEYEDERRERGLEKAVNDLANATEESAADIDAFLQRLRVYTTTSEAAGERPRTETPPALASAPAKFSDQLTTSESCAPVPSHDRQSNVEDLSTRLLRNLQLSWAKRNDELRDLTVLERELGRTDLGWRNALAFLDPLVTEDQDDAIDLSSHDALVGPTADGISERANNLEPSAAEPIAAIASDLTSLRLTTQLILAIFASLTEQTQVQSALASDAGRKLRAFRTQLASLRDDYDGMQRSEEFVRAHEARQADPADGARSSDRVLQDVEEIRVRLDRGWRQAQELLVLRA